MKNIQGYIRTKTRDEVKFQQPTFPVDKLFENKLFIATPIIGEEPKQIGKLHEISINHWVGGLMPI